MRISFTGHSQIVSSNEIKEKVKEHIRSLIPANEPLECYLGGYGDFDIVCARACKELKNEYACIQLIYISPYISIREQEKIKEMQCAGLCDSTIFPPIENTPPRYAISKRNEWMMSQADIVIAYVNHHFGGAYKSFQIAKRKNKRIINICDLCQP